MTNSFKHDLNFDMSLSNEAKGIHFLHVLAFLQVACFSLNGGEDLNSTTYGIMRELLCNQLGAQFSVEERKLKSHSNSPEHMKLLLVSEIWTYHCIALLVLSINPQFNLFQFVEAVWQDSKFLNVTKKYFNMTWLKNAPKRVHQAEAKANKKCVIQPLLPELFFSFQVDRIHW